MRPLISRRAAIVRLLASGAAVGLGAFATSRTAGSAQAATMPSAAASAASVPSVDATADAPAYEPIPVRLAEIVHEGQDFGDGVAEGVSLPGQGGAWTLTAERPGGVYTSPPSQLEFPCSHVGVHWRTDGPETGAAGRGLRAEVRSSRDGTRWSTWRRVLVEAHGRDAS